MAFIRNIEKGEKCQFCSNVHVGWLSITDNSGAYTSMYNMPFCEDHRDHALSERKRIQSRRYSGGHFWD